VASTVISCPNIRKPTIRTHYDVSTLFYRLLWGPHIHHGLWEADETPDQAQLQLTKRLIELAGIQTGSTMVDIGCGMGGSSIYLAKHHACKVVGVTLSPVQRRWAQMSAFLKRIDPRPEFRCIDAEEVSFPQGSLDCVWSIECTEHLFDKPAFFKRCATWLRPGGRIALCAWLAGNDEKSADTQRQVIEVCQGMLCPSLGTCADHVHWFRDSGLEQIEVQIWTDKVSKTWEICRDRVNRTGVRRIARLLGADHVLFLDRFDAILNAYKSKAMEYGCFVFEKPK
jgi:tocopherol O-methyltransferase